tara:strand:+ start:139 stop:399 length:261 start_codon:yes stop_codon:yes gene_type:complete
VPCRLYLHADFKRLFFRWQRVRGGVVMPALLSTKEAAAHLFGEATRKTEQIVRRMIADQELAARRIGRKFYIPAAEIERLGRPDEL